MDIEGKEKSTRAAVNCAAGETQLTAGAVLDLATISLDEIELPALRVCMVNDPQEFVIQFPPDIAHRLIMKRLAKPVGDINTLPDLIANERYAQDFMLSL